MTSRGNRGGPAPWVAALALPAAAGAYGSLDSILNIAFPDLTDDLGIEVAALQWVVISFVLSYSAVLVVAGRLADRIGHTRVVQWGAAASAVALAWCAASPSFPVLLIGRVAQGVTTAAVMAAAPALVTLSTTGDRRGRALGLFQMSAAVGLAVGPALGGPIVALVGWRGVFWVRVPVAIGLAVAARRTIRRATTVPSPAPRPQAGLMAAVRAAGTSFGVANILTALANGAMFAAWLLVPQYLVDELGASAVLGGVVLTTLPAATAVVAPAAGRLSDRFGPAPVATAGLAAEVIGLWAMSRLDLDSGLGWVALTLAVVGVGLGLFSVPNMSFVMGSLPADMQGAAGGISLMMRTAGIVAGAAMAGALFDAREASDGFAAAFGFTFACSAAICLVAFALSLTRMTRRRPPAPDGSVPQQPPPHRPGAARGTQRRPHPRRAVPPGASAG